MKKALVTALLLVIAIALLGGGWYYLRDDSKSSQTPGPKVKNESSSTTEQSIGAVYQGKMLTSSDNKFSILIPDGWKTVTSCNNSDQVLIPASGADLTYREGTDPVINKVACGSDSLLVFHIAANPTSKVTNEQDSAAFTTTKGVVGTRSCESNVPNALSGEVALKKCQYRFTKNDQTYDITYTQPDKSYADRIELIDRVVKTFVVN